MDTEVRQAERILQRSGAKVITDTTASEEFSQQYGELILARLRKQFPCRVVRLDVDPKLNGTIHDALSLEHQRPIRLRWQDTFRAGELPLGEISAKDPTSDDRIMTAFLSNFSPVDIEAALKLTEPRLKEDPKVSVQLLFTVRYVQYVQTLLSGYYVSANFYYYHLPTDEEVAEETARKEKAEQKKAAAAEKRRLAQEQRERTLLKTLQAKYANSPSEYDFRHLGGS